jgi:transposase-like protein
MNTNFTSFAAMLTALPTDQACREYLELQRWGNTSVCPHCGTVDTKHYQLKVKGEFKGMYKCRACKERFTVTVGTMFEGSPISLRKWFIATYIFSSHKKGISSHQLARDLGVTQKTAWFMLHRLRQTFTDKDQYLMGGEGVVVETDATIIGGKVKNLSNKKRAAIKNKERGLNDHKTLVVGFIERANNIRFDVVNGTETERELLTKHVDEDSVIITDSAACYQHVTPEFLHHDKVDHSKSEYSRDGVIHTNTLEGAFSLFDRMITGIYHQVTGKHLQAYCNEFGFRYNSRKMGDKVRFDMALLRTVGVKLGYNTLIAK